MQGIYRLHVVYMYGLGWVVWGRLGLAVELERLYRTRKMLGGRVGISYRDRYTAGCINSCRLGTAV